MEKIKIEDIDEIAAQIKDAVCPYSDPKKRETFELEVYNILKEALDPWRDESGAEQ